MLQKLKSKICLFCGILLCLVLSNSILAYAEDVFSTTNNESERLSVVCEDSKVIFTDFPEDNFSYVLLFLLNEDGRELEDTREYYATDEAITLDFSSYSNGIYYIQVYYSNHFASAYYSYMYGTSGIAIRVKKGKVSFVDSPVYQDNLSIMESETTKMDLKDALLATDKVECTDSEIVKLAKKITKGIKNDYDKAIAIHDWVCTNIWYDQDVADERSTREDSSALTTLANRRGVCEGYANLMAALLRAIQIPARCVNGYALKANEIWSDTHLLRESQDHAWNEAYIDNRWIIIDATWDSSNRYENGTYSKGTGLQYRKFFDPTIRCFSKDHFIYQRENYQEDHSDEMILRYGIDRHEEEYLLSINETMNLTPSLIAPYFSSEFIKQNKVSFVMSSSDKNICRIGNGGKVVAVANGTAVIKTEISLGERKLIYETKITVGIAGSFQKIIEKVSIYEGKTKNISVKPKNEHVTNYKVSFKSGDKSIAKVSKSGKITGVKAGTVIITTTIELNGEKITYETKVTVKKSSK